MANILGISAFYHDSAAALVVNGEVVAAAQEERFSRLRHDAAFPEQAIDFCLRKGGVTRSGLDYVVFYEKPLRKFERLLETYLAFAPDGFASFRQAMPVWLGEKARLPSLIRGHLGDVVHAPLVFVEHHESHAASAFFPSPFDDAAILTLDGVGEWTTTAVGGGRGSRIQLERELTFPHSLGLLYSAFTYYCGFKVNSGEYKLMGLAPYGRPVFRDLIVRHLIDLRPDGSFWMDMAYFNYCQGLTMTSERFHELFGGPPRRPEADITQRHMDLAASIQAVTEDAVLALGRAAHAATGSRRLVLAGGVALNCVANGRLLRDGPFEDIWIQPAAGDAGGALGSALFVWHQLLEQPRPSATTDRQHGSLLGPSFSTAEVCQYLDQAGITYWRAPDEAALLDRTAALLEAGRIVGWFQGRMEFGPRALGARSILGDPRSRDMQATMNLKIKFRESFRPFAPSVLREEASRWFDLAPGEESPYMLLVAPVRDEHRVALTDDESRTMTEDPDLRRRVGVARSTIPAVTHVDFSARVQTVDAARHPRYWRLLRVFQARTGCPVLVNTSFNVRGEPIVCTPEDAFRCFVATEMDALVMEDTIVDKADVASLRQADSSRAHLANFSLD
ncbi:MAG: carbamoyltransferase [Vicinamibacterales bacterium]